MQDVIIVGAGTAGCVLANRLSANGRRRVLLIEAGGAPSLPVRMPAAMTKLFKGPHDWAFETVPQAGGRVVFTPRGRMLGGSSNLSAQIHQRGYPADFDGWAEAGADGWSWRDVEPVLRQMEAWTGPESAGRGRSGEMPVEPLRAPAPPSAAFVRAAAAEGLPELADYNREGEAAGASIVQVAHRGGRRFSAYDAYLKPAMKRPNLRVLTDAVVSRVVFAGRRATGVAVAGPGGETVHSAPCVVLAAGAIGTPHLLMRSGVGPADDLRRAGVGPLLDAPGVGANLHDHPLIVLNFRTNWRRTVKSAETPANLASWLLFGRGPLSSNVVEAVAFASLSGGPAPDVELLFALAEWRAQALEPPREHAFAIGVGGLAPRSRGRLTLRTAAPGDAPSIDLGLLSDPDGADLKRLIDGVRLARRIVRRDPLARLIEAEIGPEAGVDDDAGLAAAIRANLQTIYHPAGTCRMGRDAPAPVTPDLRLKGVQGVWVADASVMPALPRAHPNAAVAMIGERASEMIVAATTA